MHVSVHAAKTQLSKLLDLIECGEEVVIERHGKPVARLVRAMRGEFSWKEGWDKPLTDEEADALWEGRW